MTGIDDQALRAVDGHLVDGAKRAQEYVAGAFQMQQEQPFRSEESACSTPLDIDLYAWVAGKIGTRLHVQVAFNEMVDYVSRQARSERHVSGRPFGGEGVDEE